MTSVGFGTGQTADSRRGNGNRRNYHCRRQSTECRGEAAKLLATSGRRHDAVLHVGVLNLPERHSGAPPEIDFRPELRAGHAGPVRILFGLLSVFRAVVESREYHWLSEDH